MLTETPLTEREYAAALIEAGVPPLISDHTAVELIRGLGFGATNPKAGATWLRVDLARDLARRHRAEVARARH